jgi:SAM-dependent methyltransferase
MTVAVWDEPELYDLANDRYVFDLPYWRSMIERQRPRRVLELACGTGRLLPTLLSAGRSVEPGFRLVGLDLSAPFLARARSRLAEVESGEAVALVEADMRAFALDEQFDLIILAFSSLQYLLTLDDQLACLRNVRRHLAPGGRFAIELVTPQPELLAMLSNPLATPLLEVDEPISYPGVDRYLRFILGIYDPVEQQVATTHIHEFYRGGVLERRQIEHETMHFFFPRELELLLSAAGLTPVERFGRYDGSHFDDRSRSYLWVMTAA